jgi:DNA polymerase I-like protein with 3'-5' exonuclease and polymerase domains
MSEYCLQDVKVTVRLWDEVSKLNLAEEAIELEHQVQTIITRQMEYGFLFDTDKAWDLYAVLVERKEKLHTELLSVFPPWYSKGKVVTPDKTRVMRKNMVCPTQYTKDAPYTEIKLNTFNPSSREHIAYWLKKKYQWVPTEFSETGKPKVDESVLSSLPYPEAKLLAEYLMLTKRLGQLAEGDQAWLKKVGKDGRLHGSVITNGAVTGRATHNNPNMAQVPSCSSPYGNECRELFTVPKGKALVGADLSGLELRCLAHFMALYDQGEYGRILLTGDIHTANQEAAGLPTRNNAKTFISMG